MAGFITLNAQNLNTEMDKVSYSLGVNIGENIKTGVRVLCMTGLHIS